MGLFIVPSWIFHFYKVSTLVSLVFFFLVIAYPSFFVRLLFACVLPLFSDYYYREYYMEITCVESKWVEAPDEEDGNRRSLLGGTKEEVKEELDWFDLLGEEVLRGWWDIQDTVSDLSVDKRKNVRQEKEQREIKRWGRKIRGSRTGRNRCCWREMRNRKGKRRRRCCWRKRMRTEMWRRGRVSSASVGRLFTVPPSVSVHLAQPSLHWIFHGYWTTSESGKKEEHAWVDEWMGRGVNGPTSGRTDGCITY